MESKQENTDTCINLLLVDDEVGYVNIPAKRLTKRDFDVTKALSGEEAIRLLMKQDFDCVVLDLKMDDMSGLEVLKIFKKMALQLSVIMLTGHGSEQAAYDGIRFGAYEYLTKPCELDELTAKIRDAGRER